jgi:hypothetical protein
VVSSAVAAANWVGSSHPEITQLSIFNHIRDTTYLGEVTDSIDRTF